MRTSTACDIGPKGEARIFELRASSGYLTPINGYIGFPYHPLVRPKRLVTACDMGPKGEARTHGTVCDIGPKGEENENLRRGGSSSRRNQLHIYIVNTVPCTVMHPHGTARVYNSAVCGCRGGN